jgi:hypothetical protein
MRKSHYAKMGKNFSVVTLSRDRANTGTRDRAHTGGILSPHRRSIVEEQEVRKSLVADSPDLPAQ